MLPWMCMVARLPGALVSSLPEALCVSTCYEEEWEEINAVL